MYSIRDFYFWLLLANYDRFSSQFNRVISIDWLGMGASSRPSFPSVPWLSFFDQTAPVDFFVDSLHVRSQLYSLPDCVVSNARVFD
jgi:hypothetical protein